MGGLIFGDRLAGVRVNGMPGIELRSGSCKANFTRCAISFRPEYGIFFEREKSITQKVPPLILSPPHLTFAYILFEMVLVLPFFFFYLWDGHRIMLL